MVVKYFFLYLVVLATANTPFLIALVHKWCKTTWEGTGRTEASSVNKGTVDVSMVIDRDETTLGWGADNEEGEAVPGVVALEEAAVDDEAVLAPAVPASVPIVEPEGVGVEGVPPPGVDDAVAGAADVSI